MRRRVCSRNIKNGCSIYIYIYDISTLRVNDLTFILLTWRKWLAPNNASRQQMGFNSGFKGLMCSTMRSSAFHFLHRDCGSISFLACSLFKLCYSYGEGGANIMEAVSIIIERT